MTGDSALVELAHSLGVATDYYDWRGRHVTVSADTVVAVLQALGIDASTPELAAAALQEQRLRPWRRTLPPCTVVRGGHGGDVRVHVPHGEQVQLTLELEDGDEVPLAQRDVWVDPCEVDGRLVGAATFAIPADLPLGWHRLCADTAAGPRQGVLVVTPDYVGVPERMGDRRAWGFMVQLYALRSSRSWGLGDLGDLRDLARWSAQEHNAGWVLVNPLHAAEPVPPIEPSPYLPVTRRFVNPTYVRVEDVPEYARLGAAARDVVEALAVPLCATNTIDTHLDREAVWAAKRAALELVHAVPRDHRRAADYAIFLAEQGRALVDYATWCALAEAHGLPWGDWPEELQHPRSAAVEAWRLEHAERVDFHCWLQWITDEQLGAAHRAGVQAGMPIGVIHDLAVGVHPGGADPWALPNTLARGVTVGAPADAFNQQGQDWSQPPWRPDALADAAYVPFRDTVRRALRHGGGLRVDHVIGMFRLWWVPDGRPPAEGTYVRYDHEALVGILALEAHRAGALVIGEDLGNVEPWVRTYLRERGILGTSILWWERDYDGGGRILRPEEWRELCLATVTTHDLPPTAGYLVGEHIRLRNELGLLTRPLEEELRADEQERQEWVAMLRALGLLAKDAAKDPRAVVEALHAFLARTPSRLVGVSLPDAVGDVRAVNQPGTHREYPNWSLPLADGSGRPVLLEDLIGSERARSLVAVLSGVR